MGRGTGLHQEFGHVAVQLGEYHRVPVVDHLDQIGSLVLGLVGGVPVQIKAVVVAAGIVGAPVRVLIGQMTKMMSSRMSSTFSVMSPLMV